MARNSLANGKLGYALLGMADSRSKPNLYDGRSLNEHASVNPNFC